MVHAKEVMHSTPELQPPSPKYDERAGGFFSVAHVVASQLSHLGLPKHGRTLVAESGTPQASQRMPMQAPVSTCNLSCARPTAQSETLHPESDGTHPLLLRLSSKQGSDPGEATPVLQPAAALLALDAASAACIPNIGELSVSMPSGNACEGVQIWTGQRAGRAESSLSHLALQTSAPLRATVAAPTAQNDCNTDGFTRLHDQTDHTKHFADKPANDAPATRAPAAFRNLIGYDEHPGVVHHQGSENHGEKATENEENTHAMMMQPENSSDDSDIPSPKWDETTCFVSRPSSRTFRSRHSGSGRHLLSLPEQQLFSPSKAAFESYGGLQATPPLLLPHGQLPGQSATAKAASRSPLTSQSPLIEAAGIAKHGHDTAAKSCAPASLGNKSLRLGSSRAAVPSKGNELTVLSLEVLASCRGKLLADPKYDSVLAVALVVWYDHEEVHNMAYESRILACCTQQSSMLQGARYDWPMAAVNGISDAQLEWHEGEVDLLESVVRAVQALDPDMIVAFDLMRGSVGYLEERAQALDVPLFLRRLGRCPDHPGMSNPTALLVVQSLRSSCRIKTFCIHQCRVRPHVAAMHLSFFMFPTLESNAQRSL
jgi:hypothetical protein